MARWHAALLLLALSLAAPPRADARRASTRAATGAGGVGAAAGGYAAYRARPLRGCPSCYFSAGNYYYRTYILYMLGRPHRCQSCTERDPGDPNERKLNLTAVTGTSRLIVDDEVWSYCHHTHAIKDGDGKNLTTEFSAEVASLLTGDSDDSSFPADAVLVSNVSHHGAEQSASNSQSYALQFTWLVLAIDHDEEQLLQKVQDKCRGGPAQSLTSDGLAAPRHARGYVHHCLEEPTTIQVTLDSELGEFAGKEPQKRKMSILIVMMVAAAAAYTLTCLVANGGEFVKNRCCGNRDWHCRKVEPEEEEEAEEKRDPWSYRDTRSKDSLLSKSKDNRAGKTDASADKANNPVHKATFEVETPPEVGTPPGDKKLQAPRGLLWFMKR